MSQHGTNFDFTNVSKNVDNYGDISLQNKPKTGHPVVPTIKTC